MGQALCFFDNKACTSMGECLVCDRFPGEGRAFAECRAAPYSVM